MKLVIQRVKRASVSIDGQVYSQIQEGLLLLVGVGPDDDQKDLEYARYERYTQIANFSDEEGRWTYLLRIFKEKSSRFLNLPSLPRQKKAIVQPLQGQPSLIWHQTSMMHQSKISARKCPFRQAFLERIMQVELVNEGPVTIILIRKIDKKDQAQLAWSFSSITKYSKMKSVLDRP